MSLGVALALAALLLEDANLRPARFTVDDSEDFCVRHKRRSRQYLAAVLFDEQHAVDADLITGPRIDPIHVDRSAGGDLHLPPAALNDCERHTRLLASGGKTID